MRGYRNSVVSPGAWILLALGMLLLPLRWLLAAITAAAFHEACHILAIRLCGGVVEGMAVDTRGAVLAVSPMSRLRELLCALAGPLGSFLLVLTARWTPAIALCGLAQGLYNLLPVYPLDGGRALRCCAELLMPPGAARIVCRAAELLCVATLLGTAVYAVIGWSWSGFLLPAALLLFIPRKFGKTPCKPARMRVQ